MKGLSRYRHALPIGQLHLGRKGSIQQRDEHRPGRNLPKMSAHPGCPGPGPLDLFVDTAQSEALDRDLAEYSSCPPYVPDPRRRLGRLLRSITALPHANWIEAGAEGVRCANARAQRSLAPGMKYANSPESFIGQPLRPAKALPISLFCAKPVRASS